MHNDFEAKSLAVLCVSLGGTKLQLGGLRRDGNFISSGEQYWHDLFSTKITPYQYSTEKFCSLIANLLFEFLKEQGHSLRDVGVIGVAFPGPYRRGRWYSNNLIPTFKSGVPLERLLRQALLSLVDGHELPHIKVVFDAQCDAGGEIYHPLGRLFDVGHASGEATVLNIATGIAAGFIDAGWVLVGNDDFSSRVGRKYDGGAGQLGRHLWFNVRNRIWRYHFVPEGQTPYRRGVRMTERLAGPALAGRLLRRLGQEGLLINQWWRGADLALNIVKEVFHAIQDCDEERDASRLVKHVRSAKAPVSRAVLQWANHYWRREPNRVSSCLEEFAEEVAKELAEALKVWMSAEGWERFGHHVILTGGVGIHFLSRTDDAPDCGFLGLLREHLPYACYVERSQLTNATERESYLFLHQ